MWKETATLFGFLHETKARWRTEIALLACAIVVVSAGAAFAQESELLPLYGPAELVRSLRLPGVADEIRRPLALHVDRHHDEIFVADTGANRIVVFDEAGLYRYQFPCADHIGTPQGIAVDSDGFVFVLGTSRQGPRLVRFDFDGLYLDAVDLHEVGLARIQGFALTSDGNLLILDDDAVAHVVSRDGRRIREIDIATFVGEGDRRELVLGRPVVRGNRLWIPVSNLGHVVVIDLETGNFDRSIGIRGNTPGMLNFPVAVDVTSEGIVAVLDKMRFAVVCYSTDGRFLGEFGGKGFRDGWFYHPSLLAVSDDDHVIVGQILDNRVQVCRIPRYVRTRLVQRSTVRGDEDEDAMGNTHDGSLSGATLRTP